MEDVMCTVLLSTSGVLYCYAVGLFHHFFYRSFGFECIPEMFDHNVFHVVHHYLIFVGIRFRIDADEVFGKRIYCKYLRNLKVCEKIG